MGTLPPISNEELANRLFDHGLSVFYNLRSTVGTCPTMLPEAFALGYAMGCVDVAKHPTKGDSCEV